MPIGLIEKICLSSAALLGTASISWGSYYLLKSNTIGEVLQKEEKLNLLSEQSSKWEELASKYQKLETNEPKKIKGPESKDINIQNKQTLRNECQKLWNTKLSEESKDAIDRKKEEIRTWCVEEPTALKVN